LSNNPLEMGFVRGEFAHMKHRHPKVLLELASSNAGGRAGKPMTLRAGFAPSRFGLALLAECPRGICHLSLLDSGQKNAAWDDLVSDWPGDTVLRDDQRAGLLVGRIFQEPGAAADAGPLRVFVRGTDFQIKVWQALLNIPLGHTLSYGQVAEAIGHPRATRATGTAIGKNPVAWLIPCHRVIRGDGAPGNYGWGPERKLAMLAWEKAGMV
jgi:AraC family transcriptional regulator of adaptative response/methylated-DNA-[protein]-cysteine methyltransferase